jgi:hypothetical protein
MNTLKQLIACIEEYGFTCKGGLLVDCSEWIEIKQIAEKGPEFSIGDDVIFQVKGVIDNVKVQGECVGVVVGIESTGKSGGPRFAYEIMSRNHDGVWHREAKELNRITK